MIRDVPPQLRQALHDRYVLERELGRGGMATVYLARDLRHDRPVALKVLHPEVAATLGPERFEREIKLAARLQHPHILTVLDSGEAAGWSTTCPGQSCAWPVMRSNRSLAGLLRVNRPRASRLCSFAKGL